MFHFSFTMWGCYFQSYLACHGFISVIEHIFVSPAWYICLVYDRSMPLLPTFKLCCLDSSKMLSLLVFDTPKSPIFGGQTRIWIYLFEEFEQLCDCHSYRNIFKRDILKSSRTTFKWFNITIVIKGYFQEETNRMFCALIYCSIT